MKAGFFPAEAQAPSSGADVIIYYTAIRPILCKFFPDCDGDKPNPSPVAGQEPGQGKDCIELCWMNR